MPRRCWPLAVLLLLAVGCRVPNPAYERAHDAGEDGARDLLGATGEGGSQGDGPVDTRKGGAGDAPPADVGDAIKLPGGDAAADVGSVVPDAGSVAPDAGSVAPDAVPGPPDVAPVAPDVAPGPPDVPPVAPDARADLPAAPVDVNPVPMGTGLLAQYYDGTDLQNGDTGTLVLQRVEGPIDYNWGTGRVVPDLDDDWFSVRWTGQIMPLFSEAYVFRAVTATNDGVRLWVNGIKVLDAWVPQPATSHTGTPITLQAFQRYDIRLEYLEQTLSAEAHLYWSSPSRQSQIVPKTCLYAP